MQLELFINFDGNCREAVEFYAKVFKTEVNNLMTYGETPPDENYAVEEADKDKVVYAGIQIGGITVMFMDMPTGYPFVAGNNVSPTLSLADKDEITRLFNELKEGGEVLAGLGQTFFSELYGMVADKYGVIWQILHYERA